MSKASPQKVWTLFGLVAACAVILVWWGLRRPPIAAGAERIATAIERRDAGALYGVALPEERESGLTDERLAQVLAGRPGQVIGALKPIGARETSVQGNDSSNAGTTRWYATSGGKRFQAATIADMAESGPSARVLHAVLSLAWRADAAERAEPLADLPYSELMLTGIRRDREFLTSVGLEGMWLGPQDGFLTWDELEARYERRLAPKGAPPVAAR